MMTESKPIMHWSNALELHLEDIDAQHERLFELHRAARTLLNDGADPARIRHEVQGLRLYARLHFEAEERFFEDVGYPAESHRHAHQLFLDELDTFSIDVAGDAHSASARLDSAGIWLQRHILEEDMLYAEFLRLACDRRDRLRAIGTEARGSEE